jgi:hypothetical protein
MRQADMAVASLSETPLISKAFFIAASAVSRGRGVY